MPLSKQRIAGLKVRKHNGRWAAGWWDERFSPSIANGDLGFYGETPEDAVKKLLEYVSEIGKERP